MLARIATIATVIINSISVKPFACCIEPSVFSYERFWERALEGAKGVDGRRESRTERRARHAPRRTRSRRGLRRAR
jgi:hypothetical protein